MKNLKTIIVSTALIAVAGVGHAKGKFVFMKNPKTTTVTIAHTEQLQSDQQYERDVWTLPEASTIRESDKK